jgi:hypothetical protein
MPAKALVFAKHGRPLQRRLAAKQIERAAEIMAKRNAGVATEQELVERWAPNERPFADPHLERRTGRL